MSNEELVAVIQAGEDRMVELWERVQRFIAMRARHVMTALEDRADVELDDLIQSGYLALVDAVADYRPEQGAFLTVLGYHLKSQFAIATRFRSARQQRETIAGALSLDTPVTDEANASTLGDLREDPSGVTALESVEGLIYQDQLHEALETALAALPEQSAEVLRLRHYQGLTLADVGERKGTTAERVRQMENKALRQLRKPSIACHLRPFYDFDFYCGTGLGAFQHSGMSIQERYLVIEEEQQERAETRRQEREQRRQARKAQDDFEITMDQLTANVNARISSMTPEEKARLLEKYGYV